MESRAHALAAGLFVILLGLGLAAAVAWFSGGQKQEKPYLLVARTRVSGLNPQAAVRYRGLEVGRVQSLNFDPHTPGAIAIRISVRADTPVTRSTYAQLGYQGLTGLAHIQLDDDGRDTRPLATSKRSPAQIQLRPSMLEDVAGAAQELIGRVSSVADRLNLLLNDRNLERIETTLASLQAASSRLVELQDKVAPGIEQVPALARDAHGVVRRADGLVRQLDVLARQLQASAGRLDQVTDSAVRLGRSGEAVGSQLMNSSLPKFDQVLSDLAHTAHNLDRLLGDLQRRPQSLIFGREALPPGPGEPGFVAPPDGRRPSR